jgi:hypothetical protein
MPGAAETRTAALAGSPSGVLARSADRARFDFVLEVCSRASRRFALVEGSDLPAHRIAGDGADPYRPMRLILITPLHGIRQHLRAFVSPDERAVLLSFASGTNSGEDSFRLR